MINMHRLLWNTVWNMCAWDEFDLTEVLVLYSFTYKIITEQTCQSVRRLWSEWTCRVSVSHRLLGKLRMTFMCSSGYSSQGVWLNEPLLLALVDGLCEGGVVHDDGCISAVGRLRPFGFVGVVGALVMEHVTHQEHQRAEDGENHHRDDAYVSEKSYSNYDCNDESCHYIGLEIFYSSDNIIQNIWTLFKY